jgi:ribosomal protein S12 methylthiotransferase
VAWLRLHYLYPDAFDRELIDLIASEPKIVKYLDIPIQHINDGILRRMGRRGTGAEIRALFKMLRESIPAWFCARALSQAFPERGSGV